MEGWDRRKRQGWIRKRDGVDGIEERGKEWMRRRNGEIVEEESWGGGGALVQVEKWKEWRRRRDWGMVKKKAGRNE